MSTSSSCCCCSNKLLALYFFFVLHVKNDLIIDSTDEDDVSEKEKALTHIHSATLSGCFYRC